MVSVIPDGLKTNTEQKEAVSIILDVVKNQKPFAYTHYGDGEALVLQTLQNRPPDDPYMEGFYKKCQKVWGVDKNIMLAMAQLSVPMIESLVKSDMLGVVFKYGIPENIIRSRSNVPLCDWMAINCLLDPLKLDAFFQGQDVRLITSYGDELRESIQQRTKSKVAVTTIPFELSLKKAQQTLYQIPEFPEPLVLWGCGGGLKNLGVHLRDEFGKTCIDIGSVMDAWSGHRTRPKFRNHLWSHLVIE